MLEVQTSHGATINYFPCGAGNGEFLKYPSPNNHQGFWWDVQLSHPIILEQISQFA
jgi:hypothetical protein